MMRGDAAEGRTGAGRRAVGAALLAAAIAATGACGTTAPEPTPSVATPTTASPTATPSPSVSALAEPTMPPEMERDDEVGAVAAAEYFMALYEWTYATGNLVAWDRVSGQTCEFCMNTHDAVSSAYVDGARIESAAAQFTNFSVTDVDQQLVIFTVQLDYSLPEATHIDAGGTTLGTIPAESGGLNIKVTPSARGWILADGTAGSEDAS